MCKCESRVVAPATDSSLAVLAASKPSPSALSSAIEASGAPAQKEVGPFTRALALVAAGGAVSGAVEGALVPSAKSAHRPETNFDRALDFSRAFHIPVPEAPRLRVFDEEPQLPRRQAELLLQEVQELQNGVARRSLKDVTGALANLTYTAYAAGAKLGVDLDQAVRGVHESNMSLLCESREAALEALQWHRSQGTAGQELGIKQAGDGRRWLVFCKRTGAVLRGLAWRPADGAPRPVPPPRALAGPEAPPAIGL